MKFTRNLLKVKKQERGIAVLMAVFTVVVIMYLVTEITYDTNVEYIVNANAVNRIKAYYAAKSGVELSLLRIKIFTKIQRQLGGSLPPAQKKLLDMIWNFPFTWPPMIPDEASGVDKDMIKDKVKESKMDATYYASISDEGSKIDLNDLNSPSKALREVAKRMLNQIFENRIRNDEEWARQNRDFKYEEVVNNIIDWVDDDRQSLNGGDEKQLYSSLGAEELPPNRAYRTVEELRMVAGMTDQVYDMLKDRVTVYGMRAINPNYASSDVLKSLDPSMKDEVVAKIVKRRSDEKSGGPFKDAGEFWGFANGEGANVTEQNQKSIPLTFSDVINFKIRSVGEYANVSREIEAIVFDFNTVAGTIAAKTLADAKEAAGGTSGGQSGGSDAGNPAKNSNKSNDPLPKGPPRIVYFIER